MKRLLLLTVSLTASVVLSAPTADNVAVQVSPQGEVRVTYDLLGGEDAVVTMQVEGSDGSVLSPTLVFGDVNRVVSSGTGKSLSWRASSECVGLLDDRAVVTLTAHPLSDLPLYCAVDLSRRDGAGLAGLEFFANSNAVPEGVGAWRWKTTHMLFRKIPPTGPDGYRMGTPSDEPLAYNPTDASKIYDKPHTVVLTKPYYIGVYETTISQWQSATGTTPTNSMAVILTREYLTAPAHDLSYQAIRGSNKGLLWPASSEVDADSFLGIFRQNTGLSFDLPTDAQWEYACRAGTTGPYYAPGATEDVLSSIARHGGNRTSGFYVAADKKRYWFNFVGTYAPNAWGLYDMLGNVWELARDRFQMDISSPATQTDPKGPATGDAFVIRGGGYSEPYAPRSNDGLAVKCSVRYGEPATFAYQNIGVRLALDLD